MCSSASPPLFLVDQAPTLSAPCMLHSDEGERGKRRLVRRMESCSRDLGEKIGLDFMPRQ